MVTDGRGEELFTANFPFPLLIAASAYIDKYGPAERYNLVVPRSRCPKCGADIKAHQNIPVVSYLLLGGKCANCSAANPSGIGVENCCSA